MNRKAVETIASALIMHGKTVFITLAAVSVLCIVIDRRRHDQIRELPGQTTEADVRISIAPGFPEIVPQLFENALRQEASGFPIEEMVKTEAWAGLQQAVAAYDQRLQLMGDQRDEQTLWMLRFGMFSNLGMLVFLLLDLPRLRRLSAKAERAKAWQQGLTAEGE